MIDKLRNALAHLDDLPEDEQEQVATLIEEMWATSQLPPFDPTKIPQEKDDFEADMEALDRVRGKVHSIKRG